MSADRRSDPAAAGLSSIKNNTAKSRVAPLPNTITRPEGASVRSMGRHLVWDQYWDRLIRNDSDFYSHFNYIHFNPIKHGLVKSRLELSDYHFSSYRAWHKKLDPETLAEISGGYLPINYSDDD
jgi:hypothetical protein